MRLTPLYTFVFILLSAHLSAQADNEIKIQDRYKSEIEQLLAEDRMQSVMEYILAQDEVTVANTIELNEIPAPPFKEEERAKHFAKMLEDFGVDSVWIDAEGNVLGLRKGTKGDKTVVLDAHLDTVFPEGTPVKVKVVGDTLFAPGIGDDTRGLAMVLAVLSALNAKEIKTEADILFIGTVGEEGLGDLRGVKHIFLKAYSKAELLKEQKRYDQSLALLDSLIHAFPGSVILDDAYFLKAEIFIAQKKYVEAEEMLKSIVEDFALDVKGDDACFLLAELYRLHLLDKERALEYYQKVMTDYAGSLYVTRARRLYRQLKTETIE